MRAEQLREVQQYLFQTEDGFSRVMNEIVQAAIDGKTSTWVYKYWVEGTDCISRLKDMGYSVEWEENQLGDSPFTVSCYVVRWGKWWE